MSSLFQPIHSEKLYIFRKYVKWPSASKSYNLVYPNKQREFSIIRTIPELWRQRIAATRAGRTIGLVPTMGALHGGHLSLIRQAAQENDHVCISLYVNPTQFGLNEDLESYPKTWNEDMKTLKDLNTEFLSQRSLSQIDTVFAPDARTMYPGLPPTSEPEGQGSFVMITPLSSLLEGTSRPIFFRGVATVCMKLFNAIQPDRAYFGQKDIQQTVVIKRMVEDFHLFTQVRVCPTIREENGLAMSSRNIYLGARRRNVATVLLRALKAAENAYARGVQRGSDLLKAARAVLQATVEEQRKLSPGKRALFEVDYISLAHPSFLTELTDIDPEEGAILCGAIKMLPVESGADGEDLGLGGGVSPVRLIDNLLLEGNKVVPDIKSAPDTW